MDAETRAAKAASHAALMDLDRRGIEWCERTGGTLEEFMAVEDEEARITVALAAFEKPVYGVTETGKGEIRRVQMRRALESVREMRASSAESAQLDIRELASIDSLDAAVAEVPEGYMWSVGSHRGAYRARVFLPFGPGVDRDGPTSAAALRAAIAKVKGEEK